MDEFTQETPQFNDNNQYGNNAPKRSGLKTVLISILVLILAGVVVSFFWTSRLQTIDSVAVKQLQVIKSGDLAKAYAMTSAAFKEATSYDIFSAYINSNSIFNDYKKITFSENKVTDNVGVLKGIIEGEDGGQMHAEYQLVQEDSQWKIQAIRLTPIGIEPSEAPMQTTDNGSTTTQTHPSIHGIMVSDASDNDGYVEETKTVIPRSTKKIFVTVMIVSPQPDINVATLLKHIPTGTILGPIDSTTTKTGNIMKAFSFTREKQLWPTGEYEAQVKLSSGNTQSIKFEIK